MASVAKIEHRVDELRDLIRYLEEHGCVFLREGARHTVYKNLDNGLLSAVPRHRQVKRGLVRKICADLDIPRPPGL